MTWPHTFRTLKESSANFQQLALLSVVQSASLKRTTLGFEYSANGIAPSLGKTKTISTWPVPKTAKDLCSFPYLVNFYRRFVHDFAEIAGPLTDLTGKNIQFKWECTHQHAFDKLKHALTYPPILNYPKQHHTFVLTTDASDTGLGAILSIARGTVDEYASRTLTKTERNYSTTEKECLGLGNSEVKALSCWHSFYHRNGPQAPGVAIVKEIQPCTFTAIREMGLTAV